MLQVCPKGRTGKQIYNNKYEPDGTKQLGSADYAFPQPISGRYCGFGNFD